MIGGRAWLTADEWCRAQAALPIACVELVPSRRSGPADEFCLIHRHGRDGDHVWGFAGGRVLRGEYLRESADRHAHETFGTRIERISPAPLRIVEYMPGRAEGPRDDAQHSISLVFAVALADEPAATGEALELAWFGGIQQRMPSPAWPGLRPAIQELVARAAEGRLTSALSR